jgi:hypothetical protein
MNCWVLFIVMTCDYISISLVGWVYKETHIQHIDVWDPKWMNLQVNLSISRQIFHIRRGDRKRCSSIVPPYIATWKRWRTLATSATCDSFIANLGERFNQIIEFLPQRFHSEVLRSLTSSLVEPYLGWHCIPQEDVYKHETKQITILSPYHDGDETTKSWQEGPGNSLKA